MGARLGVEPRLLGNESSVLPLDDPAIWLRWLESNQLPKDNETRDLTVCPHRDIKLDAFVVVYVLYRLSYRRTLRHDGTRTHDPVLLKQ